MGSSARNLNRIKTSAEIVTLNPEGRRKAAILKVVGAFGLGLSALGAAENAAAVVGAWAYISAAYFYACTTETKITKTYKNDSLKVEEPSNPLLRQFWGAVINPLRL